MAGSTDSHSCIESPAVQIQIVWAPKPAPREHHRCTFPHYHQEKKNLTFKSLINLYTSCNVLKRTMFLKGTKLNPLDKRLISLTDKIFR